MAPKRYLVIVPNPEFSETVSGIPFTRGRGVIDEMTLDPKLGRTAEQVAQICRDLGYEVAEIKAEKSK